MIAVVGCISPSSSTPFLSFPHTGKDTTNCNCTTVAAEIVRKTSEMSLDSGVIAFGEDALLHELGYRNATDLQETIYGKYSLYCNKSLYIM